MIKTIQRIIWVLLCMGLTACVSGTLTPLHVASNRATPLPQQDFQAYIEEVRTHIRKVTEDAGQTISQRALDWRTPFEWEPPASCDGPTDGRWMRGALFIHGLSDSPFLMRDVAARFVERCYFVRSILLPGHGTVPGDLLTVKYTDWVEATRRAVAGFAGKVQELSLVGFSTGTSLSMHYVLSAASPSEVKIKHLILLAPAVKPHSKLGLLANWHKVYSWLIPRGKWLNIYDEKDVVKYESFAKNAGDQFHLLSRELQGLEKDQPLTIPVFMAVSADDQTIDPAAAREVFCRAQKPRLMLWYQRPKKEADDAPPCDGIVVKSSVFTASHQGILNFSHLTLPSHPDNAWYGRGKDRYKNCLEYYDKGRLKEKLELCQDVEKNPENSEVRYGAYIEAYQEKTIRRLTFNPDFEAMMTAIFTFTGDI